MVDAVCTRTHTELVNSRWVMSYWSSLWSQPRAKLLMMTLTAMMTVMVRMVVLMRLSGDDDRDDAGVISATARLMLMADVNLISMMVMFW